ncbi:MAG: hypothetical protein K0U54_10885 [Bacteroidetes bacterium]|nr:hypothetical protein [Bacteroidota bacterium]
MKKQILLCAMAILLSFSGWGQTCSDFYPFNEGASFQITNYSKKGKVAAVSDFAVSNTTGDTATITTQLKDNKGKVLSDGSFDIKCSNNGIEMDVKSLLSPELFKQFKDFKTDISGTNIVIPNDLSVGQELPDADMHMAVDMGGINMNMDVSLTDRKVVATENVTTPAGSFDCFVITYTSNIKMGMNRKGTAKQWFAKGVGMVKQEDYNKKGKVTSSSLLTSFTN